MSQPSRVCRERRRAQLLHRQWRDACELWHAACGTQGPGAAGPLLLRHARRSSGVGAWRCAHTGRRRDETYRQRRQLGADSAKSNLILRRARVQDGRQTHALKTLPPSGPQAARRPHVQLVAGLVLEPRETRRKQGAASLQRAARMLGLSHTHVSIFCTSAFFGCVAGRLFVSMFRMHWQVPAQDVGIRRRKNLTSMSMIYNYTHRRVPSRESARARRREWRSAASQADRHVARVVPPRRSREGLRGDGGEVLDERAYAAEVVRDAREALRLGPQPGGVGVVARGR